MRRPSTLVCFDPPPAPPCQGEGLIFCILLPSPVSSRLAVFPHQAANNGQVKLRRDKPAGSSFGFSYSPAVS